MAKTFPEGFLWGSATAAHQVEGTNANSDCWALEQARPSLFREPSGDAVDQWNRFADDVAVLAALGLRAYRFSIEWARIEPEPGVFSVAALDHYQRCIDACLVRGVTPIVTFHHFTLPLWQARRGGFDDPEFPERFGRYCDHAARRLRGFDLACTLNELNVPLLLRGWFEQRLKEPAFQTRRDAAEAALGAPLGSTFLFSSPEAVLTRGLAAHAKGREAIKSSHPSCRVGLTLSIQDEAAEPGAEAVRDCRVEELYGVFLDALRSDDFIGVQTYTRNVARTDGTAGPETGHATTVMGYEDRPQALAEVCRLVWDRTHVPILVTENGWAGDSDERRAQFILEALDALHQAMAEGVQVDGYLYWSLLDNYEWFSGYGPKFGLVSVDRTTQRRTLKPSALALGQVAQTNILSTPAIAPTPSALPKQNAGGGPLGLE